MNLIKSFEFPFFNDLCDALDTEEYSILLQNNITNKDDFKAFTLFNIMYLYICRFLFTKNLALTKDNILKHLNMVMKNRDLRLKVIEQYCSFFDEADASQKFKEIDDK